MIDLDIQHLYKLLLNPDDRDPRVKIRQMKDSMLLGNSFLTVEKYFVRFNYKETITKEYVIKKLKEAGVKQCQK